MTWGFVTCGPNEALVVSGESLGKSLCPLLFTLVYPLNAECPNNTDSSCYYIKISAFAIPKLNHLRTLSVQFSIIGLWYAVLLQLHDVMVYLYTQQCKTPAYTYWQLVSCYWPSFPTPVRTVYKLIISLSSSLTRSLTHPSPLQFPFRMLLHEAVAGAWWSGIRLALGPTCPEVIKQTSKKESQN